MIKKTAETIKKSQKKKLTPYPLAARWKVSEEISISEHKTTATVSRNSRNSASSSALKNEKKNQVKTSFTKFGQVLASFDKLGKFTHIQCHRNQPQTSLVKFGQV